MQKNENPAVLAGILFAITAIVALLLAFTNSVTADKIAETSALEQEEARKNVMPEAVGFEKIDTAPTDETVSEIYAAKDASGNTLGYCVNVGPKGFGGTIEMIVGVKADETLSGITIVSLSETPGLGSKSQEPEFKDQFAGKSVSEPLAVIKSGEPKENEIAAISGATVTSKAVTAGVNAAVEAVKTLDQEVGGNAD